MFALMACLTRGGCRAIIGSLGEPVERIEITRAIRPRNCGPGEKILHTETERVKFNRT
jgi:hypothetical protein